MRYLLVIFSIFFIGCSDDSGTSRATAASDPKSIFSEWETDGVPVVLSFVNGEFDSPFTATFGDCEHETLIEGDESEGTIVYSNSIYTGAGVDPGHCDDIEGITWEYSKEYQILSICNGTACEDYH